MNAAPEIAFSSEQGKANYAAARRQYPAQAIVNLKTMRDNMAHLVSVVGGPNSGTAVMGVVKADAYGHGAVQVAGKAGGKPDPWQPAETVQTALFVQHIVLAEGVQRLNQTIFRFIIQTGIFFFKIIEYIHGLPHRKRP